MCEYIASSAVSLEGIPEGASIIEAHIDLLAHEGGAGEPNADPSNSLRVSFGDEHDDSLCAERHGAKPVAENTLHAAPVGGIDITVVRRPVARRLRLATGHVVIDLDRVRANLFLPGIFWKRVIGRLLTGRLAACPKNHRRPPLLGDDDVVVCIDGGVPKGHQAVATGRPDTVSFDQDTQRLTGDDRSVKYDVVFAAVDTACCGQPKFVRHQS